MAAMIHGTLWTPIEDKILRALHPDKPALIRALSGRTWKGILHRADTLGLTQPASLWTARAVKQLRAAYERRLTKGQLLALFPDRTYTQIARKAYCIGIRRAKPQLVQAADPALEAIRQHANSNGVTLKDLCSRAGTMSFKHHHHRPSTKNLVAGIEALAGEVAIVWQD